MRRPWRAVRREVGTALRAGSPGGKGVLAALPDLPAALRQRRAIPSSLEARIRLLQDAAREPAAS